MGSIPGNLPISLQAWPTPKNTEGQPTLIQRIDFERGGFINVTEEGLREEIAEAEAQAQAALDGDEDEESSGEEEEPAPNPENVLAAQKQSMMNFITCVFC